MKYPAFGVYPSSQNRRLQKGQGLVLFVFCAVTLVGFCALAVDFGMLALAASRMQAAADSAALAGAAKLKLSKGSGGLVATTASQTNATTDAVFIASQNGYPVSSSDVSFPVAYQVRIDVKANSPLFLAKIWNSNSTFLQRHATAEMTAVAGIGGGAPLGITEQDYETYKTGTRFEVRLVRNQEADFNPGEVLALSNQDDSNGKSPNQWQENLETGISEMVEIGDQLVSIDSSEGNQGKRLVDGLEARGIGSIFPIVVTQAKAVTHGNSQHVVIDVVYVKLISVRRQGGGPNSEAYVEFEIIPNYVVNPEVTILNIGGTPGVTTSSNIFILRLVDDL